MRIGLGINSFFVFKGGQAEIMIKKNIVRLNLVCSTAVSLIAAGDIYSRLSQTSGFLGLGLSGLDLFFLTLLLSTLLGSAVLLVLSYRYPDFTLRIMDLTLRKPWYSILLIFFTLILIETGQDYLFLKAEILPFLYVRYTIFLASYFSLLWWGFFLSLANLITLTVIGWEKITQTRLRVFIKSRYLLPLTILTLTLIVISMTDYGFKHPTAGKGYFLPTNAPLAGMQVFLVLATLLAVRSCCSGLKERWVKFASLFQKEWIILIGLWIIAYFLWMNVPLEANYYVDFPRSPNFEFSLNSDSLYYDLGAQRLLVGGKMLDFPAHPIYIWFLTILHAIGGDSYPSIIWLQVAVLSLIPVVLYKLVKVIHSRFAGLFVAALFILRERNSLLLMGEITVSSAKMVMTELFAVLCLLCFLYLMVKWLKSPKNNRIVPLLAGGVVGFAVLLRVELIIVIPFVVLVALLALRKNPRAWLQGLIVLTIGFSLLVSPWMIRNWQRTGTVQIDKYHIFQDWFEEIWGNENEKHEKSENPGSDINQEPLKNSQIYIYKNASILPRQPLESSLEESGPLQNFPHHLANNLQQIFLYLPSSHQPLLYAGGIVEFRPGPKGEILAKDNYFSEQYMEQYVRSLPYWWVDWDGSLTPRSIFPLFLNLVLISIGFGSSWGKSRSRTVLLVITGGSYLLFYSLIGSSGGRYIQVVDWITMVFYGIGLTEIYFTFIRHNQPEVILEQSVSKARDQKKGFWRYSLMGAGLLLVGFSLPAAEILIPARYTEESLDDSLRYLLDEEQEITGLSEWIEEFSNSKGRVFIGKALYPRYFEAGERMTDDRDWSIPDYSYSRIEFYLVGLRNSWVNLPLESSPEVFPHGSDVVVFATWEKGKAVSGIFAHAGYFKASRVFILPDEEGLIPLTMNDCDGSFCDLNDYHH